MAVPLHRLPQQQVPRSARRILLRAVSLAGLRGVSFPDLLDVAWPELQRVGHARLTPVLVLQLWALLRLDPLVFYHRHPVTPLDELPSSQQPHLCIMSSKKLGLRGVSPLASPSEVPELLSALTLPARPEEAQGHVRFVADASERAAELGLSMRLTQLNDTQYAALEIIGMHRERGISQKLIPPLFKSQANKFNHNIKALLDAGLVASLSVQGTSSPTLVLRSFQHQLEQSLGTRLRPSITPATDSRAHHDNNNDNNNNNNNNNNSGGNASGVLDLLRPLAVQIMAWLRDAGRNGLTQVQVGELMGPGSNPRTIASVLSLLVGQYAVAVGKRNDGSKTTFYVFYAPGLIPDQPGATLASDRPNPLSKAACDRADLTLRVLREHNGVVTRPILWDALRVDHKQRFGSVLDKETIRRTIARLLDDGVITAVRITAPRAVGPTADEDAYHLSPAAAEAVTVPTASQWHVIAAQQIGPTRRTGIVPAGSRQGQCARHHERLRMVHRMLTRTLMHQDLAANAPSGLRITCLRRLLPAVPLITWVCAFGNIPETKDVIALMRDGALLGMMTAKALAKDVSKEHYITRIGSSPVIQSLGESLVVLHRIGLIQATDEVPHDLSLQEAQHFAWINDVTTASDAGTPDPWTWSALPLATRLVLGWFSVVPSVSLANCVYDLTVEEQQAPLWRAIIDYRTVPLQAVPGAEAIGDVVDDLVAGNPMDSDLSQMVKKALDLRIRQARLRLFSLRGADADSPEARDRVAVDVAASMHVDAADVRWHVNAQDALIPALRTPRRKRTRSDADDATGSGVRRRTGAGPPGRRRRSRNGDADEDYVGGNNDGHDSDRGGEKPKRRRRGGRPRGAASAAAATPGTASAAGRVRRAVVPEADARAAALPAAIMRAGVAQQRLTVQLPYDDAAEDVRLPELEVRAARAICLSLLLTPASACPAIACVTTDALHARLAATLPLGKHDDAPLVACQVARDLVRSNLVARSPSALHGEVTIAAARAVKGHVRPAMLAAARALHAAAVAAHPSPIDVVVNDRVRDGVAAHVMACTLLPAPTMPAPSARLELRRQPRASPLEYDLQLGDDADAAPSYRHLVHALITKQMDHCCAASADDLASRTALACPRLPPSMQQDRVAAYTHSVLEPWIAAHLTPVPGVADVGALLGVWHRIHSQCLAAQPMLLPELIGAVDHAALQQLVALGMVYTVADGDQACVVPVTGVQPWLVRWVALDGTPLDDTAAWPANMPPSLPADAVPRAVLASPWIDAFGCCNAVEMEMQATRVVAELARNPGIPEDRLCAMLAPRVPRLHAQRLISALMDLGLLQCDLTPSVSLADIPLDCAVPAFGPNIRVYSVTSRYLLVPSIKSS